MKWNDAAEIEKITFPEKALSALSDWAFLYYLWEEEREADWLVVVKREPPSLIHLLSPAGVCMVITHDKVLAVIEWICKSVGTDERSTHPSFGGLSPKKE